MGCPYSKTSNRSEAISEHSTLAQDRAAFYVQQKGLAQASVHKSLPQSVPGTDGEAQQNEGSTTQHNSLSMPQKQVLPPQNGSDMQYGIQSVKSSGIPEQAPVPNEVLATPQMRSFTDLIPLVSTQNIRQSDSNSSSRHDIRQLDFDQVRDLFYKTLILPQRVLLVRVP